MATANDLVTSALRVISSVTPGEAVGGAEAGYALSVLNMMLAAWSAESLMPPFRTLESFPLNPGQNSYTVGPGANFDTARPDYVTAAWRRDANGLDTPLKLIPKELYDPIRLKSLGGPPRELYYDAQYPNGVLYLFPADAQADALFLESLKPVNQFSSLNASMTLPGEYEEAIKYLLAKRLAPEYGFPVSADMKELMDDAEARVKRKNTRAKPAAFDPMTRRHHRWSIHTGC